MTDQKVAHAPTHFTAATASKADCNGTALNECDIPFILLSFAMNCYSEKS